MSEPENDVQRVSRLFDDPNSATKDDVRFLASRCSSQESELIKLRSTLRFALKGAGRFRGLREAAELVEAAADRELKIRFLGGKLSQNARAVNNKLLRNTAQIIRQYAGDAEAGKLEQPQTDETSAPRLA